MAYMIGTCCTDQIAAPPGPGGSTSGLNEIILFTNATSITIAWNAARKARFGDAAVIYVEILGADGIYRRADIEMIPNSIINTTSYTGDLGGVTSGRVVIT